MRKLTRFHKERALRAAGVDLPPFPSAPVVEDDTAKTRQAERAYLLACNTWEDEVDSSYLELLKGLPPITPSAAVLEFVERCESHGLTAGLLALNGRVDHRYTALYQLDSETLKNVDLVDKAGEARPEFLAEVPIGHSFCQFVFREGCFLTSDSAGEARLAGHPYQGVMVSYHGVPVLDDQGELFGSLCHFDVVERHFSDAEFEYLQDVARAMGLLVSARRA